MMCDTLVVLGNSSEDGSVLFAKNSDREPNEAHTLYYLPGKFHEEEQIQCQYISIPQVKETFAVILSKPVWLKIGCEMGANEFGVVIGNEAVFTKEKYEKIGLLGMELLTFALQRAKNAQEALGVVIDLLEKYGQGGTCSSTDPNEMYHNSFIIADLNEAWILETANKFWVAKKVRDIGTISNGLTIKGEWDLAAPNLVEHAIEEGWCESESDFNFADCYSDPELRVLTGCIDRQSRIINRLLENKGKLNVNLMMDIIRDHGAKFIQQPFKSSKADMSSVCMHYSSKSVSQTTASYVAQLNKDLQVHWLTGTSAPCLSLFKPFFFESPEPLKKFKIPSLKNDNVSLWWKHEKIHRLVLMDYLNRAPLIIRKNRELERQIINEVKDIMKEIQTIDKEQIRIKLNGISTLALSKNFSLIDNLKEIISKSEIQEPPSKSYIKGLMKLNEKIDLNLN